MSLPLRHAAQASFGIAFGSNNSSPLVLPIRPLGGNAIEALFPAAVPAGRTGDFTLCQSGEWLLGHANAEAGDALATNTQRLYRDLLKITAGGHLARIWNYVPDINGTGADGLENYRAFCSGRAAAFESAWGEGFRRLVPAASAVGCHGPDIAVVFAATTRATHHVENPAQVPAYHYPAEYGPCSPSFARATYVDVSDGCRDVFISGTAAIRGHATFTPGDTIGQLGCTLENLRTISHACGIGHDLAAAHHASRSIKIYLRHAEDFPRVAEVLSRRLLQPTDQVSFLHAEICRADLNVEIEATIFGAKR